MGKKQAKTGVDLIVSADFVLTMDEQFSLYTPGAVAVRGDTIVAVGDKEAITAAYEAGEMVDAGNAVLMPGLVNVHGHAPMTLLRGLADDLRLDVWLMGYIMPVERHFVTPHFSWLGTQLAAAEMIRSGTTTFMDMYYFEEAVADSAAQAGLRAVCAQTILKFPAPDAMSYEEELSRARDFVVHWKGHPLIVPGVAPHAPYTVTEDLLAGALAIAQEYDVPLHIHLAETAFEVEGHRKQYGVRPVAWLEALGLFEAKVTAAHCVHLNEEEIAILKAHNVGVAHNPSSNLKLASGIAPIAQMLAMGVNVGVGTDGPASNNDLDMIEEMRLASLLAKQEANDPTALPARQTLAMATILGARAMHIEHLVGSLEPGKRADMITIEMGDVRHQPYFRRDRESIYSRIVYASHASDVRDVMVNGRWLMRDRKLLTLELEPLLAEVGELAQAVDTFLIHREGSVLSKLLAIGNVAQEQTFEVQVKAAVDDLAAVEARMLADEAITVTRNSMRPQFDTYFLFDDEEGSILRYREDEVHDLESGELITVIYRLTLTTAKKEREYENSILLSRSRFDAPADRSLRFYREYFRPKRIIEVQKERRRYHIRFGGTDFAVNFDRITKPPLGSFVEIKSRTWSRQDAERKAALIGELIERLRLDKSRIIKEEYVQLAQEAAEA